MTEHAELASWMTDPYVVLWPELRPFWAAAAEGRFLMPRCDDCGSFHWHPRAVCPFCRSQKISWIESAGRATLFSYSVARTRTPPYVVAFVQTEEGPVILTQLVGCDLDTLAVDMAVSVSLRPVQGGRSMPFFACVGVVS